MAVTEIAPIFTGTVYRHATATKRIDGSILFLLPERLPFEDRDDTVTHVANGREYLWDLAQMHYPRRANAFDFWEIIAQFQPEPIQDASVPIPKGKELLIPSASYIEEVVNGQQLSEFPEI